MERIKKRMFFGINLASKNKALYALLVINFFVDAINNFLLTVYNSNFGMVLAFKSMLCFVLAIMLRNISSYGCLLMFCIIFAIREVSLLMLGVNYNVAADAIIFFRFILLFVALVYFNEKSFKDSGFFRRVERIFFAIFFIQCISIILGYILEIDYFRAYQDRLGYKGLFWSANDTAFFMIIGLLYTINKKKWIYKGIAIVSIGILGMGSRTALLSLLLIPIIISLTNIICFWNWKIIKKALLYLGIILGCLSIVYINFLEISQVFFGKSMFLFYYGSDWSYIIFTGRIERMLESFDNIKTISNVLFGYNSPMIEIDIVDFFARFGLVGTVVFLLMLVRVLKVEMRKEKIFLIQFLLVAFFVGNTMGHVLLSGMNAIWIGFFVNYYNHCSLEANRETENG